MVADALDPFAANVNGGRANAVRRHDPAALEDHSVAAAFSAAGRRGRPPPHSSVSRLRISSPVAGALIFGMAPFETNDSAFLIAMKTEMPRSRGGSPTALLERMLTVFPSLSIVSTLKISGRS